MEAGGKIRWWLSVLACFGIGLFAFAGIYHAMAIAVVFPFFWFNARCRSSAWILALAYYLGGLQGLLVGSAEFFGKGLLIGGLLWFASALIHSFVWGIFWHREQRWRLALLPLGVVVSVVTPYGFLSWVHPLSSAGVLFPRFGFIGLTLCVILICAIAAFSTRVGRMIAGVCLLLSFAANIHDNVTPRRGLKDWYGHDSNYRNNAAAQDLLKQYEQQIELLAVANAASPSSSTLFPEISSGIWSNSTARLWQSSLREERGALLGAILLDSSSCQYHNIIVGVTKETATILYRQRMPSPVSMWRPWADNGCVAHWFENPVFTWRGKRIAGFICHEQFCVWPWIQSMFCRPDAILATGNVWWASHTTIPALQRSIVRSWAALGNFPLVSAFNK